MPPAEFKPTISANERPQTYALDRAATGISNKHQLHGIITNYFRISFFSLQFFFCFHPPPFRRTVYGENLGKQIIDMRVCMSQTERSGQAVTFSLCMIEQYTTKTFGEGRSIASSILHLDSAWGWVLHAVA
jgi:hypothetical protein